MTDAADCRETSCSPERPPYKTATRIFCISVWQASSVEPRESSSPSALLSRHQFAQDKRQNTAVPVVIDLDWRIDSQFHRHRLVLPVLPRDFERDGLSGLNRIRQSDYRIRLRTVEPERLGAGSFGELE